MTTNDPQPDVADTTSLDPQLDQQLLLELRRGTVALAVLGALRQPAYGYALQQRLADRGFDVDQGTLYPLLRRLAGQGLLESDWNVEGNRPRKYYQISPQGLRVLATMSAQWRGLVAVVDALLAEPQGDPEP